jgi:hypothetical protein
VSRVNVAVAISDDAQGQIYEIAAACRAAGLHHSATLAMVGLFTGSVESGDLEELLAVPGVLAVEVEYAGRSEITWRARWPEGAD